MIAENYIKSHATSVKDIMTRDVVTAFPDTPLHDIAGMFEESHINRVPIVSEGGDLVGIVTRANIIQAIAGARPRLEVSVPDATIRTRLLDELKKQPWAHAHRLNVAVSHGVVDLWGFAESDTARRAIRVAAESMAGVTTVNDPMDGGGHRLLMASSAVR